MGVVPPVGEFLECLRAVTREHGSILIFDEVLTGFRVHPGGAQALFGVTPDLTTLGKIIGGGLPVGAFGGRAELLNLVAPAGPVYQAGTMSGNPVTMTAGLATLALLDEQAYRHLELHSRMLAEGMSAAAIAAGVDLIVQRVGSMLTVYFRRQPVRDFVGAESADHEKFARFFHAMLRRGIHLPPSGFEAWFVSLAHGEEAIGRTLSAAGEALAELTG
jgi:glutamate-1-semialdehyde 2,1-aminomutase